MAKKNSAEDIGAKAGRFFGNLFKQGKEALNDAATAVTKQVEEYKADPDAKIAEIKKTAGEVLATVKEEAGEVYDAAKTQAAEFKKDPDAKIAKVMDKIEEKTTPIFNKVNSVVDKVEKVVEEYTGEKKPHNNKNKGPTNGSE